MMENTCCQTAVAVGGNLPLVSVIVPNYNYERFLVQRLDTVLNQTYPHIEVIILDDCSTDHSAQLIEERYARHPKVSHVVINTKNSGSTFVQWQKGFSLAKGEYIWIAEADDYAELTFLEKIVGRMRQDSSIMVGFSNSTWVTPDTSFINKDYTIPEPYRVYEGADFIKAHLLKENYIYNASMAVFRRSALDRVNPEYVQYKSCGDKLFWSSLIAQGKAAFVCEPLNNFRIHSQKVTSNSIISGLLFHEEHRLFQYNLSKGYITLANRYKVVSYFIDYVQRTKADFLSDAIYQDCLQMWKAEANPRNSSLPWLYRVRCLFAR